MTQEDKNLLLKDLFARLLYNPFVRVGNNPNPFKINHRLMWTLQYGNNKTIEDLFKNIKPYLRPMSSMTDKERQEYDSKRKHICDDYNRYCFDTIESIDWLNAHHFDYRNLIEKGLAIAVTEENNPYKE